jgi:hypothetical protein
MTFNKLWIDDIRDMPEYFDQSWTKAPSAWEALTKIQLIDFKVISIRSNFRSKIGKKVITKDDIMSWISDERISTRIDVHYDEKYRSVPR